ncbi:3949_t:CDS:1, partial [Racocetra persica]
QRSRKKNESDLEDILILWLRFLRKDSPHYCVEYDVASTVQIYNGLYSRFATSTPEYYN